MRWDNIDKIDNDFLHDAILVNILRGYNFISLYMDKNGECAATFNGIIKDEEKLKDIIRNFHYGDADVNPVLHTDYEYNLDDETTTIYTPDGVDYREWKYWM